MDDPAAATTLSDRLPVPGRYVVAAAGAFVLLFAMGTQTTWIPFADDTTSLTGGARADLAAGLGLWSWATAPALALWRPVAGGALASLPFAVTVLDPAGTWPVVLVASLLGCAVVSTWRSTRTAVVLAALAMVPVLTYLLGATTIVAPYGAEIERLGASPVNLVVQGLLYAAVAGTAVGLGLWMRASYAAALESSALAHRAGAVERESVVLGERARLARDLHDVVAHHVSLIAVRAETAPYTVTDLSAGATTLLAEIADDSRRALDELRGVLGILVRTSEGADLAPQPGAEDITTLVESARRGGDDVTWTVSDLSGASPAAAYVAYRVVQEALTNARRHAPGAPVRLEVTAVGSGLLVRVDNESPAPDEVVDGRGLSGMRERVEALGGTLTVGPVGGSLRIEASVPGGPA